MIHKNESRVYHSLLGLPIVYKIAEAIESDCLKGLTVLSVASHHTALHQELYSEVEEDSCYLQIANRQRFENIIYELVRRIGINSFDVTDCYATDSRSILGEAKDKLPIPSSFEEGIDLREYFVEIQGILNYSDWLASGQPETSYLNLKENFLPKPYYYQLKARKTSGNVFITLPTGSGKTETALSWIHGNLAPGLSPLCTSHHDYNQCNVSTVSGRIQIWLK